MTGVVPPADPIYRRDAPTGSIRVRADGNQIDVEVNHVGHYTLFISSQQFDLSQPIQVTTNGQVSFSGVALDKKFMLERAAEDADRQMIYEAAIEIGEALLVGTARKPHASVLNSNGR